MIRKVALSLLVLSIAAAAQAADDVSQFTGKFTIDRSKCSHDEDEFIQRVYISKNKKAPEVDVMFYGDEAELTVLQLGEKSFANPTSGSNVKRIIQRGSVKGNKLISEEIYVDASGRKKLAEVTTLTAISANRVALTVNSEWTKSHCEFVRVR